LEVGVREGGDVGRPCVLDENSQAGKAFGVIAKNILDELERSGTQSVVIED
jgi:hypothetical protein